VLAGFFDNPATLADLDNKVWIVANFADVALKVRIIANAWITALICHTLVQLILDSLNATEVFRFANAIG
jgi:hypothetical protein